MNIVMGGEGKIKDVIAEKWGYKETFGHISYYF